MQSSIEIGRSYDCDDLSRQDFLHLRLLGSFSLQRDLSGVIAFGEDAGQDAVGASTGTAPTFLSDMSLMASKTVASGVMVHTVAPL